MTDTLNLLEWGDVTPVSAFDAAVPITVVDSSEHSSDAQTATATPSIHPIVSIRYPKAYEEACGYLRAVLLSGEKSERVLALTRAVISINPAHYTCWTLRRQCLESLYGLSGASVSSSGADADIKLLTWKNALVEEQSYIATLAVGGSKNYQLWYHRKWCFDSLFQCCTNSAESVAELQKELSFTQAIIGTENKHYHAWAHRQYACHTAAVFVNWDAEIEFAAGCIRMDVRNNSGWNHRWFCITHQAAAPVFPPTVTTTTKLNVEVIMKELEYAFTALNLARKNESVWNYVRGLLRNIAPSPRSDVLFINLSGNSDVRKYIVDKLSEIREAAEPDCNHFANELMSDILVGDADAADAETRRTLLSNARKLLAVNADFDDIRAAYWGWRMTAVDALLRD